MMNETPQSSSRRARVLRWAALGAVPLVAVAVAYFATRSPSQASDTAAHAGHGTAPTTDSAQPVMLSAADARRIGVTFDVASFAPLAREIRTVGQVTYDETRVKAVALKIDGWVERLHVNFTGQAIGAGAPLLAIYSPMLVTAQEELLLAQRLVADVASGSTEARANAASLLGSARRRLAYWDVTPADIARIEQSGEVQRTLTFRSPVNGFVVEKSILQGQRVMAGDALYRIADLGTVWVEGEVFERDLASVRLGQEVRAELEALPGRARTGRITYIYPTLNPETRTSRVRVELSNAGLQLKPGMYATLIWRSSSAVSALSVPRTAVIATGQRNLVFVKRADGMLEPREVQLGVATVDRIEILSGIVRGDTVVKSATFLLDAESNLATLLGGMGEMPGMDMTAPASAGVKPGAHGATPAPSSKKPEEPNAHAHH